MNIIINKFLLTVDKFLPEFHLKEPGFTYSGDITFTKYCKRFREKGNLNHLYISDKTLKDKVYKTSRNRKYDGY